MRTILEREGNIVLKMLMKIKNWILKMENKIMYGDLNSTIDESDGIQFELNLEEYTATQYVNDVAISHYDYVKENGSVEKTLDVMKFEMEKLVSLFL